MIFVSCFWGFYELQFLAAMRRICSIGVGTTVYGRPCSRQIFAPSAFGQNAQKGNDDNENEHETRDGNSNCKVPLRKANCARIIGCLKK